MKIKIGLKSQPVSCSSSSSDSDSDKKVSSPPKISINSKKEPSSDHLIQPSSECDLDRHIRDYFLEPLKDLINNDGVSNGCLIANVDALLIMKKILKSILKKKKISIVEILEKAAFEDSEETETVENDSYEENYEESDEDQDELKQEDEQDEDEEEDDEDEDEEEDEEEEFDEYDLEEARECDSYCYDEDESMDG